MALAPGKEFPGLIDVLPGEKKKDPFSFEDIMTIDDVRALKNNNPQLTKKELLDFVRREYDARAEEVMDRIETRFKRYAEKDILERVAFRRNPILFANNISDEIFNTFANTISGYVNNFPIGVIHEIIKGADGNVEQKKHMPGVLPNSETYKRIDAFEQMISEYGDAQVQRVRESEEYRKIDEGASRAYEAIEAGGKKIQDFLDQSSPALFQEHYYEGNNLKRDQIQEEILEMLNGSGLLPEGKKIESLRIQTDAMIEMMKEQKDALSELQKILYDAIRIFQNGPVPDPEEAFDGM